MIRYLETTNEEKKIQFRQGILDLAHIKDEQMLSIATSISVSMAKDALMLITLCLPSERIVFKTNLPEGNNEAGVMSLISKEEYDELVDEEEEEGE